MNPKTEEKILKSYLVLIDSPDANEKKYRRFAQVLFTIAVLLIFYVFSDSFPATGIKFALFIVAFLSGLCAGLGVWLSQMGSQTKLFIKHLSKTSINERIHEISA